MDHARLAHPIGPRCGIGVGDRTARAVAVVPHEVVIGAVAVLAAAVVTQAPTK